MLLASFLSAFTIALSIVTATVQFWTFNDELVSLAHQFISLVASGPEQMVARVLLSVKQGDGDAANLVRQRIAVQRIKAFHRICIPVGHLFMVFMLGLHLMYPIGNVELVEARFRIQNRFALQMGYLLLCAPFVALKKACKRPTLWTRPKHTHESITRVLSMQTNSQEKHMRTYKIRGSYMQHLTNYFSRTAMTKVRCMNTCWKYINLITI